MAFHFELDFDPGDPAKGQFPAAGCEILLSAWGTHDDRITIGSRCYGRTELKSAIEGPKRELDEILKEEQSKFKAHERTVLVRSRSHEEQL